MSPISNLWSTGAGLEPVLDLGPGFFVEAGLSSTAGDEEDMVCCEQEMLVGVVSTCGGVGFSGMCL